jgi:thymidylate synthase
MRQYLEAVREILTNGERKENRTGVDTLSTFSLHYNIDLQKGFPLLTTKAIEWKNIVVEMLWFLSGETNILILKKHGCKFWDAWADPETGEVPSAYGNFWRKFPVHDKTGYAFTRPPYHDPNAAPSPYVYNDQLAWLVNTLIKDPMSRRMVVSAWAPGNAQTSKLPPCHCQWIVNVQNVEDTDGRFWPKLCLHLTQRSCDIALGVPYNIASYALLMHLLSRFSGIPVGTFGHTLVDAHAYTCKPDGSKAEYDHVPGLREQLTREPRPLPRLSIHSNIQKLDDINELLKLDTDELMKHFVLEGYDPHPAIKFKVAV